MTETVVVVGAHGKIGLLLAHELVQRGRSVRGIFRRTEQSVDVAATGAEPVVLDLETADVATLAQAFSGADAVVFTAGAGTGSGPARKQTVDLGGSLLSIDAARLAGVRRFVQVSHLGADTPAAPDADPSWAAYQRAKQAADQALRSSELDWTVVRPARLTDAPASGLVELGDGTTPLSSSETSRGNVAQTIAAVLALPTTVGLTVGVVDGTVPVVEALESLHRP